MSTGDVVLAEPFALPAAGFEIQGLQAELGTLTKRRPGGPQEELNGRELEAHVLRRFAGQVGLTPLLERGAPATVKRCHKLSPFGHEICCHTRQRPCR